MIKHKRKDSGLNLPRVNLQYSQIQSFKLIDKYADCSEIIKNKGFKKEGC